MTPGLLLPAALAALVAVIVPLVIHIARRSEDRPITFAALRWRTWMDQCDALIAFAEIATVTP